MADDQISSLALVIGALLGAHGYTGVSAASGPPRVAELSKALAEIESSGVPSAGTNTVMFNSEAAWNFDEEISAWADQLPADQKRAAPETYRTIMSGGFKSVRDYVNSLVPFEKRDRDPVYLDLFNAATGVDFLLKGATSAAEVAQKLTTSDQAEISLSRIASYVHERRTGDRDAAAALLAVRPPGALTDIAPAWKIADASVFSQGEHKRRERANFAKKAAGSKGDGKTASKGKGKAKDPKKDGHTQG